MVVLWFEVFLSLAAFDRPCGQEILAAVSAVQTLLLVSPRVVAAILSVVMWLSSCRLEFCCHWQYVACGGFPFWRRNLGDRHHVSTTRPRCDVI